MRILLAEDEKDLARAIEAILTNQKIEVIKVENGLEAINYANKESFDCFVFDIMMPECDGLEALKKIRETGDTTPTIFLTAKSEVDDKVLGLEIGADDYLTKPFSMKELIARIKALTRRQENYTPSTLKYGKVTLNVEELELKSENTIRLALKEAKLMEYFLLNTEKILTSKQIMNHVWNQEDNIEIVDVYVSYLNEKLKAINANITIHKNENGYQMRNYND